MIKKDRVFLFSSGGGSDWPPCDEYVASGGFWRGGFSSESLNSANAFVLKRL